MGKPGLRFPKLVDYTYQATVTANALAETKQNTLRDVFEMVPVSLLNK